MQLSEMTELLSRQAGLIRKAVSDLENLRDELPSHRQVEMASVIGRLVATVVDDEHMLKTLAAEPSNEIHGPASAPRPPIQ